MTLAVPSGFVREDRTIPYLGDPAGYIVSFENGTKIYFAGDSRGLLRTSR